MTLEELLQISPYSLRKIEKEEQIKPRVSRRKVIIIIRIEIHEIENRKSIAEINSYNQQKSNAGFLKCVARR